MRHLWLGAMAFGLLAAGPARAAEKTAAELTQEAAKALDDKDPKKALELARQAVKLDPKYAMAHYACGIALGQLRKFDEAVAAFDETVKLEPEKGYAAYDQRGTAQFKRGKIKEAVADFEKFLDHEKEARPYHWRLGIAYYYAGRHKDGAEQFVRHQKVNPEDVENAVWHFLCQARDSNVEDARKKLMPIKADTRVPMKEIHALYAGKAKPEDVLAAAEKDKPKEADLKERLFYAHLYLGLYYEALGDAKKSKEHIDTAVEKYMIGHYMGDVARVHRDLRAKGGK